MVHLLIIPGDKMIHDDFEFIRSNANATKVFFEIKSFKQFSLKTLKTIDYKSFRHLPHTHSTNHIW